MALPELSNVAFGEIFKQSAASGASTATIWYKYSRGLAGRNRVRSRASPESEAARSRERNSLLASRSL